VVIRHIRPLLASSVALALTAVPMVSGQGTGAPPRIPPPGSRVPVAGFTVVNAYPHDPTAFTQGLEFRDGVLYESTGLQGRSGIRKVTLETGKVIQEFKIAPGYFGEGLTVTAGKLFQLSWKDKTGFVYDAKTFRFIRNFSYFGEGWGLTHDETSLIMSDGTSALRFLETTRFSERKRLKVMDAAAAIPNLNELEMIKGEIWANIWQTDYIARISPKDGHVVGWVNLKGLLPPAAGAKPDVLNGIAYDSVKDRIFVTGKLWPKLFEIKLK
jgi:glutamine cyclotransferase